MARRISFVNCKGGVGKTSLAVNIASSLAALGRRVLLLDMDAQSNASIWLMRLDRWNALNSDPGATILSTFMPGGSALRSIIIKDVVRDREDKKLLPGLDLAPTTFNLMDFEHEYRPDPARPFVRIMYDQIEALDECYDYIIFDCPPNVFRSTQAAIFSSTEIIAPVNPDALSLIGFSLLAEKTARFHCEMEADAMTRGRPKAKIRGIILNSIKSGARIDVPRKRMAIKLQQFVKQAKASPDAKIFDTVIRDAIIAGRAVTLGMPIPLLGRAEGAEAIRNDYMKLASDLDAFTPAVEKPEEPSRNVVNYF